MLGAHPSKFYDIIVSPATVKWNQDLLVCICIVMLPKQRFNFNRQKIQIFI
jgi:hypothetical protein